MSQENVETFMRAMEAGNRRDIDAMVKDLHPDVEWHPGLVAALSGVAAVWRGREAVRQGLLRDFFATFDHVHFTASEIRDLGDQILAIGSVHAHGTESGIEIDSPWAYLVRIQVGKAIWVRNYTDVGQALEDAGPRE